MPTHLDLAIARPRRPRAGSLILAAALAACGCNSMSGQLNNQVGMRDYRQGDFRAARVQFGRAVADDPFNASFAYNLACALKHTGDAAGAEQTYRHAIQIDPTHQPSYHGLAALMNEEGRQPEALELISTWAAAQPRHPGAQIELAWIEREHGDRLECEKTLYRALALDPGSAIATARLGDFYQEAGKNGRAMAMYERSLRANWMQPDVRSKLAALSNSRGVAAPPTVIAWNPAGFPLAAYPSPQPVAFAAPSFSAVTAGSNDDPAHL
jgi:Tfp pilus assembly protein PilF